MQIKQKNKSREWNIGELKGSSRFETDRDGKKRSQNRA